MMPLKTYVDLMNYLQTARKGNGKCYLFIDEIQDIKNFEIALRSLQSDPDWDISCPAAMQVCFQANWLPIWLVVMCRFASYSLIYSEFLQFHQLSDSSESFLKYLKFGGCPT